MTVRDKKTLHSVATSFPRPHTLTGEIHLLRNFASNYLGNRRHLIVYLPPDYRADETRRYPVLYLHDGQNLFDRATAYGGVEWGADETAEKMILEGKLPPLILVGLYNTGEERIDEYTPTFDREEGQGGKAEAYGRMLIEEAMPFITHRYRILSGPEHTGLGGSSLGGLVTLYLGLRYPSVFGKLMVMSPSVWWDNGVILRYIDGLKSKPDTRIWLDVGRREGKYTPGHVALLKDLLVARGWRLNADLKFLSVRGGRHHEADWGKRFGPAIQYLFGQRKQEFHRIQGIFQD